MDVNKDGLPRVRLAVPKICEDCGHKLRYIDELDTHDLRCIGPIRLIHTEEGIFGEVSE